MLSFTFVLGRCWVAKAFGFNPIIRLSDRVEAAGAVLAIALMLGAAAAAGAIGTAVHDSRAHLYAEQADTRHSVTAQVVARSTPVAGSSGRQFEAPARWPVVVGERSGSVSLGQSAEAGDQVDIWIDSAGHQVPPPVPQWQAGIEAAFVGIVSWLVIIGVIALAASLAQGWLIRQRNRRWDDEWRALTSDNGGLTGRQR